MNFSFISHLDDCYYALFYCVDVFNRSQSRTLTIEIPSPAEYFRHFALEVTVLQTEFQKFSAINFSEQSKLNISKIWGTGLDLSLNSSTAQSNPLLYLHYLRWCESMVWLSICITPHDIPTLLSSCRLAPVTSGDTGNVTMKGRDPLLSEKLRVWCDSCRIWPCHLFSFATPSSTAIRKLVELSPLVEIGAGTGYWAHMIRQAGGTIHCYDRDPPSTVVACKANSYHGRTRQWTAVMRGGHEKSNQHGSSVSLFLCYPPPDNDMALSALRAFKGNTLCYVGKFGGDTGTRSFEKLLISSFECYEILALPNWTDTSYSLMIWRRKTSIDSRTTPMHPFRCSSCGLSGTQINRCRLTYNVYFCGVPCALRGQTIHFDELVMRSMICSPKNESIGSVEVVCRDEQNLSKKRKRNTNNDGPIDLRGSKVSVESVLDNNHGSASGSSDNNSAADFKSLDVVDDTHEREQRDTISSKILLIPLNMSYFKKVYAN